MRITLLIFSLLFTYTIFGQAQELTKDQKIQYLENKIQRLNKELIANDKDTILINKTLIDYTLNGFKTDLNKDVLKKYLDSYYYVINHPTTKSIVNDIVDQIILFKDELEVHVKNIPQSRK